jgi:hypothetical protein
MDEQAELLRIEAVMERYSIARACLAAFDAGAGNDDNADALLDQLFEIEGVIAALPARTMRDLLRKSEIARTIVTDELEGGPHHWGMCHVLLRAIEQDLLRFYCSAVD